MKWSVKQMFSQPAANEPELFGRIRACLEKEQGAEALKVASAATATDKQLAEFSYLRGLALEMVGRHDEALAAFSAAVAADGNHVAARRKRDDLAKALDLPAVAKIPAARRPWGTALPRPTLLRIQQALHNYAYRGVPMLKNPFDMALYPLLLWQIKPQTLLEIGSKSGGSALWFGDLMNNFGIDGHIYSVDIVRVDTVSHPRVTFMEGNGRALESSLPPALLKSLPRPWLVIEDADHAYETSIAALRFFHPWLQPGEYIVVEDGIISDLADDAQFNSGPHRALKEFLHAHGSDYEIDSDYCDFFGHNLTWCTNGFLKKIR